MGTKGAELIQLKKELSNSQSHRQQSRQPQEVSILAACVSAP